MMKVLIVTMGLDIGGAETHTLFLCKGLQKAGITPIVVSSGGVYVEELTNSGIAHYEAPLTCKDITSMIKSFTILRRLAAEHQIDLIHAHGRIPTFVSTIVKRAVRRPLIVTVHAKYKVSFLYRLMSFWGNETISISDDLTKYFVKLYKVDTRQITLIENAVDTELFQSTKKPYGSNRIVYISRLDESLAVTVKTLIDAICALDTLNAGITLSVAGDGPCFHEVRQYAERANQVCKSNRIRILGKQTDIPHLLERHELAVCVSRTALEAMSCERMVILAGGEGYMGILREEIYDQVTYNNLTGRGYPLATAEQLAKDIQTVLFAMPVEEKERICKSNRDLVLSQYALDSMIEKTVAVYKRNLPATSNAPKNVFIFGYHGFGNIGDEATLHAIIENIRAVNPHTVIDVLTYNSQHTKEHYQVNAISRNNLFSVIRSVKRADIVMSGGGTLLQNVTSNRSLLYYLTIIFTAHCFHKKVVFYSNGFGPVKSLKRLTTAICNQVDTMIVRDSQSKLLMERMGIHKEISVSCDSVFGLSVTPVPKIPKKIMVSVREWKHDGHFVSSMAAVLDKLVQKGYSISFVLMDKKLDEKISYKIMAKMKRNNGAEVLNACAFQEEMKRLGTAHLVIGMRLHANIFALMNHVPCVMLEYDLKIRALARDFQQPLLSIYDQKLKKRIYDAVMDIERNYALYEQHIIESLRIKETQLSMNRRYLEENL